MLDKAGRFVLRALLKAAKQFDDHPAAKALICRGFGPLLPPQLDTAVGSFLGGATRCFYWPSPIGPQSVSNAVKAAFRSPPLGDASLDGGFLALRYLSSLLSIAAKHNLLLPFQAVADPLPAACELQGELGSSPERGTLLIAHPALPGWFSRTVVLLCDHGPPGMLGTFGLCLNKPWGGSTLDLVQQGRKAGAAGLSLAFLQRGPKTSVAEGEDATAAMLDWKEESAGFESDAYDAGSGSEGEMDGLNGGEEETYLEGRSIMDSLSSEEEQDAATAMAAAAALGVEINDESNSASTAWPTLLSSSEIKAEADKRERLEEALVLAFGGGFWGSEIGGGDGSGGALIISSDDDELVNLLTAAANAMGAGWDGELPEEFSLLTAQSAEAAAGLEGVQRATLMAVLQALGRNETKGGVSGAAVGEAELVDCMVESKVESSTLPAELFQPPSRDVSDHPVVREQQEMTASPSRPFSTPQEADIHVIGGPRSSCSRSGSKTAAPSAGSTAAEGAASSTLGTSDQGGEAASGTFSSNSSGDGDGGEGNFGEDLDEIATAKQLMAISPRSAIFLGGPIPGVNVLHVVQQLGGHCVSSCSDSDGVEKASEESGVMFGSSATVPQAMELLGGEGDAKNIAHKLRFFLGSSQWAPGQLEDEISRGSWAILDLSPGALDLFSHAPEKQQQDVATTQTEMWRRMLNSLGPHYGALATIPPAAWEDLQHLEI